MRKLFIALAFMATLGMVAAPVAYAQTKTYKKKKGYKKKKAFIFRGGDNIWGSVLKPSGKWIMGAKQPIHINFIEYRLDFNPEMYKLTEEL